MKLFKVDTAAWTVREVEGKPWPGSDSDGERVYDNTHFSAEADAWEKLEREAVAFVELSARAVVRASDALRVRERDAVQATVALEQVRRNRRAASGVMASQPAQPLTALQIEDMVAEIMGDSWADFVADTGCFPDDFKLEPGRRLSFTPGAWAHMVGRFVAERLSPVFWCEQTQTWLYKDELRKAFKNRPLDPQPPAPVSGVQAAPAPDLQWCESCGEGVTNFCRGKLRVCPKGLLVPHRNAGVQEVPRG